MSMVTELNNIIEETTYMNACFISQEIQYYKLLKKYMKDFNLISRNCVADIIACRDSRIFIIDTKVKDIDIWPAPLRKIPNYEKNIIVFLVHKDVNFNYLELSPHNSWCFNLDTNSIVQLASLLRKRFKPEYSRIFKEVRLMQESKSFFVHMENESKYLLLVDDIPEADSSSVVEYAIGENRHYFWFKQESGNLIEIPWDDVLYHCEPEYQYYKGKNIQNEEASATRIMKNIKSFRNAKGYTIAQLAKKSGLLRPNLSRLENGKHVPSLETIAKLANALDVTVADIVARK